MIVLMYGAVVCTKWAPTNVSEVYVDIHTNCMIMHSWCMHIVHTRWLEGMHTSCMIVHMHGTVVCNQCASTNVAVVYMDIHPCCRSMQVE